MGRRWASSLLEAVVGALHSIVGAGAMLGDGGDLDGGYSEAGDDGADWLEAVWDMAG